jgi:cytochrome P450
MILSWFYIIDLLVYSTGPKEFLQKRQALFGGNFAALGRIIAGEYEDVKALIEAPQKRGAFLGRARLVPSKFANNFLLFLSDEGAGGTGLHSTLHSHFWSDLAPAATAFISSKEEVFAQYLVDGMKKTVGKKRTDQEGALTEMTTRYMYHAFFGAPLTDKLVQDVCDLVSTGKMLSSMVLGGTKPFTYVTACFQCPRASKLNKVTDFVLGSPLMADYVPGEANGNQSREDYAEMMINIISIAGIIGTSNLLLEVLTIPESAEIDLNDKKDVMMAVLEAARLRAPVNNANILIPEEKMMVVNGTQTTLPANTNVAASIGLASLDGGVFPQPDVYNHKRENLIKAVIDFNHLGFSPEGSGTRQCPGRNIAMKMASDVFKLHRIQPQR